MNQDSIQKIYDEIGQLQIELEPDPTILGPRYINEITAKCRNHLNKVTLIRLRISREKRALKSRVSGEETLLSAEKDRLLAEDETVKRHPNVRDREAVANTILRDRLNNIAQLKNELLDLDTVEKAVTLVHDELIRTGQEIKTQRSVMLADRVSGAGYGDEYDGPRDGKSRPPTSIGEDELDRLMQEGTPTPVTQESTQAVETPEEPTTEPQEPVIELPEDLVALAGPQPSTAPEEHLPEPVRAKSNFVDQAVKKDPSAGLPEDQEVLQFLGEDLSKAPETKAETKASNSTKSPVKSKIEDDEFDLNSLLQNL